MKKNYLCTAVSIVTFICLLYSNNIVNAASHSVSGYISSDMSDPKVKNGFSVSLDGKSGSYKSITDENGYFSFISDLDEGIYTLNISKSNCLTRTIADVDISSNMVLGSSTEPIIMWLGDLPSNDIKDDTINIADVIEIAKSFSTISGDPKYDESSDLNSDGSINLMDVLILAKHFNDSSTDYPEFIISSTYTNTPSSVPTPTTTSIPSIQPSTANTPKPTSTKYSNFLVTYTVANVFGSGATVNVSIKNTGTTTINSWKLSWTFSGDQKITDIWNASKVQDGTSVTIIRSSHFKNIPPNESLSFGFNMSFTGTNEIPKDFVLGEFIKQ